MRSSIVVAVIVAFASSAQAKECAVGKACGASCIDRRDVCTLPISGRAPTCVVGCECGNSCIDCNDQCRVDGASAGSSTGPDYDYCERMYPNGGRGSAYLGEQYRTCLRSEKLKADMNRAAGQMIDGLERAAEHARENEAREQARRAEAPAADGHETNVLTDPPAGTPAWDGHETNVLTDPPPSTAPGAVVALVGVAVVVSVAAVLGIAYFATRN